MEFDLKKTLEALLLSTAEPISLGDITQVFARHHSQLKEALEAEGASREELATIVEPVKETEIRAAINELTNAFEVEDRAYRIVEGPNGYQIVTAPQFAEYVRLLRGEPRPMRLSPAALETLSIIAYRQPVTRAEVEAIRGVSVDGPLNRLIEWELVHVVGRSELPGRPIQYGTTDRFLEFVGIKDLDVLPASDVLSNRQVDDWIRQSAESRTGINDRDVGLAEESEEPETPVSAVPGSGLDWQMENIESDAASSS